MRLPFVVLGLTIALAACGARSGDGPAWPKQDEPEADGGESLEPRTPTVVAEGKDEKKVVTEEAKPAADTAKPADATTPDATATPAATETIIAPEDVITVEEIVIEIEDE